MSPFLVRAYHPLLGSPPDPYSIYTGELKEDDEEAFLLEKPKASLEIKKETVTYTMKSVTTTRFVPLNPQAAIRQPTCFDRFVSLFCCCFKKSQLHETSSTTTMQRNTVVLSIKEPASQESLICQFDETLAIPSFDYTSPLLLAKSSEIALKVLPDPLQIEILSWRQNMIKDTYLPKPEAVVWLLTQGLNFPECRLIKLLLLKKENARYIPHLTRECKHVLHHIKTDQGSPIFTNLNKASSRPPSPTFDLRF